MPINLSKFHPFKVHSLIQPARPVPAHIYKKRSKLTSKCYCDCACSQYVPSVVKDICKEVLKAIGPQKKRIKQAESSFTDGELDRYGNGSSRTTRRKTADTIKDKLGYRLKGGSSQTDARKITTLKLNGAEFLTIPDGKNSNSKKVRLIEDAVDTNASYRPSALSGRCHKKGIRYVDFNKKNELVKLIADEVKSAIEREIAGSDKLRTIRHPSRKLRGAYQRKYSDVVELYKIGTFLESSSDDIEKVGRKKNIQLGKKLVPKNQEDDKNKTQSRKLLKSKTIHGASYGDADRSTKPEKKKALKTARAQGAENSVVYRTGKFLPSGVSIGERPMADMLTAKYKKKRISKSKESRRERSSSGEKYGCNIRKKDRKLMISQALRGVASDERMGYLKSRRPSRYVDRQIEGERQSRKRSKSLSKRRCDTPSRERRKRSRSRTSHLFSDYHFQDIKNKAQALKHKSQRNMSKSRTDQGTSMGKFETSRERGGCYDSGKGDRLVLKVKLRKPGTRIARAKNLSLARSVLLYGATAEVLNILDFQKAIWLSRRGHSRFDEHRSCDYLRVRLEERDAARGF